LMLFAWAITSAVRMLFVRVSKGCWRRYEKKVFFRNGEMLRSHGSDQARTSQMNAIIT
jgi:hypothetical protein